ncbi:YopX family protein [Bacillus subtilis]|uniref:YopX family protein n=1 Tax=Bacillus subtilis TaxID=1423 RepID=UPI001E3C1DEF|nr:YopX family protein [Bacillus subtilis]MEC2218984.1 YopX family protein [Bacillus subtilis]
MREIKFRAWNAPLNKMDYSPLNAVGFDGKVYYGNADITGFFENIMQYTGLKDKNGREIYEGDIVVDGRENSAEVVFDDGCFCVIGYLGDLRTHPLRDSLFCGERFEVIGNIYEDPELLEAAE